jgi:hydrogenase-4 component E
MTPLLIALLGVLLVPLFVATWRTTLFGLGCQGILMALIATRVGHASATLSAWIALADLAVVRGLVVPLILYRVLRAQGVPRRSRDFSPPNLLFWTLALGSVLAAFQFAELLMVAPGARQTLVAVAAAAVMLGLLVLATQSGPLSQMAGVLRIENAIALLELGGEHHPASPAIQLGMLAVFVATVALFRGYLIALHPTSGPATRGSLPPGSVPPGSVPPIAEGPTL